VNRREFLRVSGSLAVLNASGDLSQALAPETAVPGSVLPPWQPGFLDTITSIQGGETQRLR
jgi:hypothetical protein